MWFGMSAFGWPNILLKIYISSGRPIFIYLMPTLSFIDVGSMTCSARVFVLSYDGMDFWAVSGGRIKRGGGLLGMRVVIVSTGDGEQISDDTLLLVASVMET
ncbi:Uncharacterized protein TCM_019824 [Theobroma cacao]|uniref:Uncharacterized protein n=1 Tax=Theobroma cacao TaxID=3641 RepID=A0A061EIB3_THECC|nr:Uncharacterized protein TCM_019824 [Theobroma cacao]